MGDGVNIAARLEGIAAPAAICLSEDAYRQVKGGSMSLTGQLNYTGVGPDIVQMRPRAGYDLVRYMPEALRVGDTR